MEQLLDYVGNHPLLAGSAMAMAVVVLGFELRQRAQATAAVSATEAVRLMNDGAVVVDIRSANQFKDGHIQGARNIPGDQLEAGNERLAKLKGKTLIACCDSGVSSAAAARKLVELGFGPVHNLRGGLGGWRQDNLPTVKD